MDLGPLRRQVVVTDDAGGAVAGESLRRFVDGETLAAVVADVVRAVTEPMKAETERLRADVATLREHIAVLQRSGWRGTWRSSETYEKGSLCVSDNELWVCAVESTNSRPGTGAWRKLR